ncbi:hypothetical protein [Streptomyces sp. NPDC005969]|uniref:hypothetical protein n=1 Tax=Streptomyces sp. NPDC005969 TaxID=3156722 RepID=UPI0033C79CC8
MLLRLASLAVTHTFTLLRLLPMSERDKDIEILTLRHQLLVPRRQVGKPAGSGACRPFVFGEPAQARVQRVEDVEAHGVGLVVLDLPVELEQQEGLLPIRVHVEAYDLVRAALDTANT